MKQLAQILIFEFAQQAVARGGQSIFSDLNLYWEVPGPLRGRSGHRTERDSSPERTTRITCRRAQRFVNALFDVYLEGDAMGRPFFFPKPNVHMTEKFFKTEGHEEFLNKICQTSPRRRATPTSCSTAANTAKISECCRLTFKLDKSDLDDAKTPWKMRYSAMQNVTINLPRVAYEAHQDDAKLFELLRQRRSSWWPRPTCRRGSSSASCSTWASTDPWPC